MRLTLKELYILEKEIRIIDPTVNKGLTAKEETKLLAVYNNLWLKIVDEINKKEKRSKK